MNRLDHDEHQVRAWLQGEAQDELPDWVLRQTFAITRTTPQSRRPRGWLASIRDRITSGNSRSNMITFASITTIAAAGILALNIVAVNDSQPSMTGAAELPVITVEGTFTGSASYGPPCQGQGGVEIEDCYQLSYVTFDDPRLQGSLRMLANSAYSDQGIYRNQFTITTDDGAWVGDSVPGLSVGESNAPSVHLFEGEGAYEGLYAVAAVELNGWTFSFEGHVVSGGFPELP